VLLEPTTGFFFDIGQLDRGTCGWRLRAHGRRLQIRNTTDLL
jgi:hypothetical protein